VKIDLRLGDCLEILPTLPDKSVDAIITDPPYGIDKADWDGDVWDLLKGAADECARIIKPEGVCFWFCSIRYLPKALEATAAIPYRWQFIWYASNNMQHGDIGFAKYTPCLVLSHGKAWRNMQDLRNVAIPPKPVKNIGHPTQKPIDLIKYLVEKTTKEGGVVLDPFIGSGTTAVACVELGRDFVGCELKPEYYDLAQRRIAEAQKQMVMPL
jgi:DNA modification methylase